jgi:DNA-binding NarL/FixJ family response regulator
MKVELDERALGSGCVPVEWIGRSDLSNDALDRIEAAKPDVIVLAFDAHDRRVNYVLKRLKLNLPDTRLIALTATNNKRFALRLLRRGIHGYLSQPEVASLLPAIQAVMLGDIYLSPTASGALLTEYRKRARARKHTDYAAPPTIPTTTPSHRL